MHAVLQGFGEDPVSDTETPDHARQIGTHVPGIIHSNAILGLNTPNNSINL